MYIKKKAKNSKKKFIIHAIAFENSLRYTLMCFLRLLWNKRSCVFFLHLCSLSDHFHTPIASLGCSLNDMFNISQENCDPSNINNIIKLYFKECSVGCDIHVPVEVQCISHYMFLRVPRKIYSEIVCEHSTSICAPLIVLECRIKPI